MTTFTTFSGKTRPQSNSLAREASFSEIPLISLTAPHNQLIEQLRDACTRVGFFYVKDHGVSEGVIDDVFECAERFFKLGKEEKETIHYKKSRILRGYEPPAEVWTDELMRKDLVEAFNWGYEKDLDLEAGEEEEENGGVNKPPNPMTGPNVWPQLSEIPDFKTIIKAYYSSLLTLGRRLIRLFAIILGQPPSYFDAMFKHPGAMGRLLHYPPQPPTSTSAFGIGAHTDIECFTILCQGLEPGLQILNNKGEWLNAPPIKGTFAVNIGDMLSYWSNDSFVSTVHRVLNQSGKERYSVPFFMGPGYETVLEPLEYCVREGEKAYDSVVAGDYVWKRLARSRLSKEEYELGIFQKGEVVI